MAGFFTPPVTGQDFQELGREKNFDFDVDVGFVSKAPAATWTDAFSSEQRAGSFNHSNYGWENLLEGGVTHYGTIKLGRGTGRALSLLPYRSTRLTGSAAEPTRLLRYRLDSFSYSHIQRHLIALNAGDPEEPLSVELWVAKAKPIPLYRHNHIAPMLRTTQ